MKYECMTFLVEQIKKKVWHVNWVREKVLTNLMLYHQNIIFFLNYIVDGDGYG